MHVVHPFVIPIACLVVVALLFATTWNSLVELWLQFDFPYSHGTLAVGIALLHIYERRRFFLQQSASTDWKALILILGTSLLWFLCDFLQIQIGQQLLLVPMILFLGLAYYGVKSLVLLIPPCLYIFVSIPIWDYSNHILQDITVAVTTELIEWVGIAAYISGNQISIPYGTFEIANGCSGLRYFLVTLALVIYFVCQRSSSWPRKLAIFFVAIMFALLTNWIRVFMIIIIGYESEMQHSIVHDHEMFGWWVYIGVFIPVFFLLKRIEGATDIEHEENEPTKTKSIGFSTVILPLLVLASGPILSFIADLRIQQNKGNVFEFNSQLFRQTQTDHKGNWQLAFAGGTNMLPINVLTQHNQLIEIRGTYYPTGGEQGEELVNYFNKVASEDTWRIQDAPANLTYPKSTGVIPYLITNNREKKLVYGHYLIGSEATTGGLKTKLNQLNVLLSPGLFQGYLAYGKKCKGSCVDESIIMSNFIDQLSLDRLVTLSKSGNQD